MVEIHGFRLNKKLIRHALFNPPTPFTVLHNSTVTFFIDQDTSLDRDVLLKTGQFGVLIKNGNKNCILF